MVSGLHPACTKRSGTARSSLSAGTEGVAAQGRVNAEALRLMQQVDQKVGGLVSVVPVELDKRLHA
jgi:hypothetical protein